MQRRHFDEVYALTGAVFRCSACESPRQWQTSKQIHLSACSKSQDLWQHALLCVSGVGANGFPLCTQGSAGGKGALLLRYEHW